MMMIPENRGDIQMLFNEGTFEEFLNKRVKNQFIELYSLPIDIFSNSSFSKKKKAKEASDCEIIKPIHIHFLSKEFDMIENPRGSKKQVARISYEFKHSSDLNLFGIKPHGYNFKLTDYHPVICTTKLNKDIIAFNFITECNNKMFSNELYNESERFRKEVTEKLNITVKYINAEISSYNDGLYDKALAIITDRKKMFQLEKQNN